MCPPPTTPAMSNATGSSASASTTKRNLPSGVIVGITTASANWMGVPSKGAMTVLRLGVPPAFPCVDPLHARY